MKPRYCRPLFLLLALVGLLHGHRAQAQSGTTDRGRGTVTCASDDGRRHYCRIDTRGGVQMVNQRSGSPCIQGRSWGYDNRGVWVDRGCRADFAVRTGWGGGRPGGPGFGPGGPGGPGFGPGPGGPGYGGQQITCSSNNNQRSYCRANIRGGVQLVNQRSGSPCVQNRTWGWDRNGIWVDRGCRADFAVR